MLPGMNSEIGSDEWLRLSFVCAQAIACYDHHCEGRSGGVSCVPGKHKVPFENAASAREIRGVIGQQQGRTTILRSGFPIVSRNYSNNLRDGWTSARARASKSKSSRVGLVVRRTVHRFQMALQRAAGVIKGWRAKRRSHFLRQLAKVGSPTPSIRRK
jgi:hypothetical protein